jgi:Ca2+-binding RTX toxin-like protein
MLAVGFVGIVIFLPNAWALKITCINVKCNGSGDDDTMSGTMGDDEIQGYGGNDIIDGHLGHDWMQGNEGDDVIFGSEGNDRISGGPGNDGLWGSLGHDLIYGEDGNDMIGGSQDSDSLIGGRGADKIEGREGDDIIWHSNTKGPNYDPTASDGSKDIITCGDGYDKVFYGFHDGDEVSNDCEEINYYKPPPRSGGNEDCDRSGMPGCS